MPEGPKGEKRPADVVGDTVHVMRIATGAAEEGREPGNPAAVLGRIQDCRARGDGIPRAGARMRPRRLYRTLNRQSLPSRGRPGPTLCLRPVWSRPAPLLSGRPAPPPARVDGRQRRRPVPHRSPLPRAARSWRSAGPVDRAGQARCRQRSPARIRRSSGCPAPRLSAQGYLSRSLEPGRRAPAASRKPAPGGRAAVRLTPRPQAQARVRGPVARRAGLPRRPPRGRRGAAPPPRPPRPPPPRRA